MEFLLSMLGCVFTYLSFCIVYVISYVCIKFVIWCYYPTLTAPCGINKVVNFNINFNIFKKQIHL